MKARTKATGEIVEVTYDFNKARWETSDAMHYEHDELEIIEEEINWEQRTWDAAVAIMTARNIAGYRIEPKEAVKLARILIAEYRK